MNTDRGIFTVDGKVIWDGEAEDLGAEPLTGAPLTPEEIANLGFDPYAETDEPDDYTADPEDEAASIAAEWRSIASEWSDIISTIGAIDFPGSPDALAGQAKDGLLQAAGAIIVHNDEQGGETILFVRHAERGTWEFPGGGIEPGETAEEAARREMMEEIGFTPEGKLSLMMRDRLTGVDYSTFIARAKDQIEPALSDELTDWQWAAPTQPPQPLHAGARMALDRLGMDELDIARAIADGRLSSPQQHANMWLFALRVTGTGVSYRPELNEFVWRDPALYLNSDFLARCNGLAVIWQHPPGDELDQSEFENRVIGSIMLGYLVDDEVWGVAKIYDQTAAQMMLDLELSTSPAVVFRDPSVNRVKRLPNGKTLLIEGKPSLLDHLAVCELGVWDKGGEPTGISVGEPEMAQADDEVEGAFDDGHRSDAAWKEGDHPREKSGTNAGQFAGGGGGKLSAREGEALTKFAEFSSRSARSNPTFTAALAKLPPHKGTVYRGMSVSAKDLEKYKPGAVIVMGQNSSSSTDDDAGRMYALSSEDGSEGIKQRGDKALLLKIKQHTGRKIPAKYHPEGSGMGEVVLLQGTRYRVEKVETQKIESAGWKPKIGTVAYLVELDDDEHRADAVALPPLEPIGRDAFLYMPPKGRNRGAFAQCATCHLFKPDSQRCANFDADTVVIAHGTCGLYVNGEPTEHQLCRGAVTPEQAGYVEGQVRCENCAWFAGAGGCRLFRLLSERLPRAFDTDPRVEPKGCCNAWTPTR